MKLREIIKVHVYSSLSEVTLIAHVTVEHVYGGHCVQPLSSSSKWKSSIHLVII